MQRTSSERPIGDIRLDGGRPCLDFVNTIHDRSAKPAEDYIATPPRYLDWSLEAGLLTPEEARTLRRVNEPALMHDVARLRASLYAVLGACIDKATPPERDVAELDRWVHRAWHDLRVDPGCERALSWSATARDAHLPLKRIALSALALLADGDPARLKRCESQSGCGWLFYDETKNNRRRWCAMETCGTLAKMRRFRSAQAQRH